MQRERGRLDEALNCLDSVAGWPALACKMKSCCGVVAAPTDGARWSRLWCFLELRFRVEELML